jgi:hypothetical protein
MAIEAEKKSNEAIRDYPDWNVVKEYPDGYRMVRLPDVADSEEAFKIGKACGERGGWCTKDEDNLRRYGSGDSRVNLLLDPDGKPVAQIETEKQDIDFEGANEIGWKGTRATHINQIKGKYNQKPKAEHIPYIQDFIKSGDYANVKELSNADMVKARDKYMALDDIRKDAKANYSDPDEVDLWSENALINWIDGGRNFLR